MKTGYHAVYCKDFYEGIDDACKNGFDFAQFDLGFPKFFLNDISEAELSNIRDYARKKQVEITFHSPGDNVSLICDYPIIRRGILEEFALMLHKANALGARHMTFHPGAYPLFKQARQKTDRSYSEHYGTVFYENLKHLTEHCGNVLVCVENLDLDETKRQAIERCFAEGLPLYLTLDTAKMYSGSGELKQQDFDFFLAHKDRIREMHIHDRNKEFGSHQIVGDGFIDFSVFKQFVNENVYVNFEVRPVEAAK